MRVRLASGVPLSIVEKDLYMNCENCNNIHNGNYGTGRFCSQSCARSFSTKKSKNKKKTIFCVNCNEPIIVSLRSTNKLYCIECKMKGFGNQYETRICPICNKIFYAAKGYIKVHCSRKCSSQSESYKEKQRCNAFKNKLGGHTSKKSIYYKTKNNIIVYLQSSYELKVAKVLDKQNIKWIRPKPFIWVDKNNISHRYYPDFYLPDYDIYLDPKNDFLINDHSEKINLVKEQNDINLVILSKNDLNWKKILKIIAP